MKRFRTFIETLIPDEKKFVFETLVQSLEYELCKDNFPLKQLSLVMYHLNQYPYDDENKDCVKMQKYWAFFYDFDNSSPIVEIILGIGL